MFCRKNKVSHDTSTLHLPNFASASSSLSSSTSQPLCRAQGAILLRREGSGLCSHEGPVQIGNFTCIIIFFSSLCRFSLNPSFTRKVMGNFKYHFAHLFQKLLVVCPVLKSRQSAGQTIDSKASLGYNTKALGTLNLALRILHECEQSAETGTGHQPN